MNDRIWPSLSAIAQEATGTCWNGPRSFGLRNKVLWRNQSEDALFTRERAQTKAWNLQFSRRAEGGLRRLRTKPGRRGLESSAGKIRRRRFFGRLGRPPRPATPPGRYPSRTSGHHSRLKDRPADALTCGLRTYCRGLRGTSCKFRFGHSGLQHNVVHGAAHPQCPSVLRPVRARGDRREDPRQDRGLEEEGHVVGGGPFLLETISRNPERTGFA